MTVDMRRSWIQTSERTVHNLHLGLQEFVLFDGIAVVVVFVLKAGEI